MRAAIKLLLLSLVTFAAAFVVRRTLFWDVTPISWDHEAPQGGALEMAFLLLSIENIAGVVAALALVSLVALWVRRRAAARERVRLRSHGQT
jgi:hypothetical protein